MNFFGAHNYTTLTHDLWQLTPHQLPGLGCNIIMMPSKNYRLPSKAWSLDYSNPNKSTEIYTDGSPIGISAVLTQEGRVIQFASQAFTPVQITYHHMGIWVLPHLHFWHTIHYPHWWQATNCHFQQYSSPTTSLHRMLGIKNKIIWNDCLLPATSWQPSWVPQRPWTGNREEKITEENHHLNIYT